MYIYLDICISLSTLRNESCIYIHKYIYMYIHVWIHIYICIYACIYTDIFRYVHVYICVYTWIYIYIYIYMYMHDSCLNDIWTQGMPRTRGQHIRDITHSYVTWLRDIGPLGVPKSREAQQICQQISSPSLTCLQWPLRVRALLLGILRIYVYIYVYI